MKIRKLVYFLTLGTLLLASGCGAEQGPSTASPSASEQQHAASASEQSTVSTAEQSAAPEAVESAEAVQLTEPTLPEQAAYPDAEGIFEISDSDSDPEAAYDNYHLQYDSWTRQRTERLAQAEGSQEGLMSWWKASMPVFLSGSGEDNRVYSPINTYLALSMLADTVDGASREQILAALDADSIETARDRANAVWNANYVDDGTVTSLLGASLWLSDDLACRQSALDTLTENYYASTFRGSMGSAAYNSMLHSWINAQTGNLLQDSAAQLEFDPSTVLALATTIYYRAKWENEFEASETTTDSFHGAAGDTDCSFMHRTEEGTYYCGDHFSAIARSLENSGSLVLILPDEGTSPEALTDDAQVLELLSDPDDYSNQKQLMINESIPRFDVSSDTDLVEGLRQLGITDVFDAERADFSPILEDTTIPACLSQVSHAARLKIDEEGVEAAAYTVMMVCGSALPPEEQVDFVLDRPFLFVILSDTGAPLFAGIVNQVDG